MCITVWGRALYVMSQGVLSQLDWGGPAQGEYQGFGRFGMSIGEELPGSQPSQPVVTLSPVRCAGVLCRRLECSGTRTPWAWVGVALGLLRRRPLPMLQWAALAAADAQGQAGQGGVGGAQAAAGRSPP